MFLQTQWELRGLDYIVKPSDFVLSINGLLYSEKRGMSSRLKGHLKFSVKFAIPPSMAMIPREVFRSVGEAVCMSHKIQPIISIQGMALSGSMCCFL